MDSTNVRSSLRFALLLVALLGPSELGAEVRGQPRSLNLLRGSQGFEELGFRSLAGRVLFFTPSGISTTDGTEEGTTLLELPGDRHVDRFSLLSPGVALLSVRIGPPEPGPRLPRPRETWITDGTQEGTALLREIGNTEPIYLGYSEGLEAFLRGQPLPDGRLSIESSPSPMESGSPLGVFDSFPRQVVKLENSTVLETEAGLWKTDGTANGTSFVGEVEPAQEIERPFSPLGDQAYYFAREPGESYSLWQTRFDGRRSQRVAKIPGDPRWLFTIGPRSYFSASFHLWSVELAEGTVEFLGPIDTGVSPFPIGDRLIDFRRFTGPEEASVLVHTPEGRVEVLAECCNAEQVLSNDRFENRRPREREFFRLNHPSFGREWWVTDGTQSGTHIVVDACPGPCDGGLWLESTERVGPHLVFTGRREVGDGPRQVFLFNEATRRLERVTDFQSSAPANEGGVTDVLVNGHTLYMIVRDDAHGLEPWALDATPIASCEPSANVLCLDDGRFAVTAQWQDFTGGSGEGVPRPLTEDTGSFWFFDQENLELIVKVLDGTALNDRHWVFYGSLSNVEFELEVADTLTGERAVYHNPSGRFASVGDTDALPRSPFATPQAKPRAAGTANTSSCGTPGDLCLGNRFAISVQWRDFDGNTGTGQPIPLTHDTGGFWFFDEDNIELVLKVLDGTAVNGNFWVFYGALSNVAFDVTVTDELTGQVVTYENPLGTFASVGDDQAFPPQP